MSPAPAKTSDADIIRAASTLTASQGAANVTLRDVANAVGIRAPSLYKRFADRTALMAAVREHAFASLLSSLQAVESQPSPAGQISALAHAYRAFAHANPELYRLLYTAEFRSESAEAERQAAAPLISLMQAIVGEENALHAARTLTALLHGFSIMEIEGNFRLGGSIDSAFDYALSTFIKGLTA